MPVTQTTKWEAYVKEYADPTIVTLGTVAELTATIDKCGGSGDAFIEQPPLKEEFAVDCPE
jgi:hypothetical protein